MPKSKAMEAEKEEPKNAFDLMMGRDKSVLRYKGFRELGTDVYSVYAALADLDEDLAGEDDVPDMDYDEFYERYWHRVVGRVSEEEFEAFWEDGDWETLLCCYDGDGYDPECGPGVILADVYCEPEDLKTFVQQRGLKDPFSYRLMDAYYYARVLAQADKDYRFRFLDLPTELRLYVYRELLLLPEVEKYYDGTDERFCHPAILQTCHEVNAEANSVLYDENIIECGFSYYRDTSGKPVRRSRVHNAVTRGGCSHAPFARIPDGIDDYPEFLSRISRLHISIQYHNGGVPTAARDEMCSPLGHYLYTLASFLMDNHRLTSVDISIDLGDIDDEYWLYGLIFWPLRRLRNIKNVTIADVPSRYKMRIVGDLTSTEPAFNTMKHWKLIQDEAVAQLELFDSVFHSCDCEDCERPLQVEEISAWLQTIENEKYECCLSSRLEEVMMARLAHLRDLLKEFTLGSFERLVLDVKTRRAAYADYEKGTDDGRLAEAAKIWKGKMNSDEKNKDDHDWSDDEGDNTISAMNMDDEPETDSFHDSSSSDSSSLDAAQTAYIAGVVNKVQSGSDGTAQIQQDLNKTTSTLS